MRVFEHFHRRSPSFCTHQIPHFTSVCLHLLLSTLRAPTTASSRSGAQMTAACWRRCAAMLPRSPTWPSATRTPWLPPARATRPSECGVYRPAPRWLSWRHTLPPSPHCRYVGTLQFGGKCLQICGYKENFVQVAPGCVEWKWKGQDLRQVVKYKCKHLYFTTYYYLT